MYDSIVIGGGPAGLSAAINFKARNRNAALFGQNINTSFLSKAEKVDNYLGMPGLSGKDILDRFQSHAHDMGVVMKEGRVTQILAMGDFFGVNFENDFFQARTVVLSIGIKKGKVLPGEDALLGKGVSYCATCDGMLYRGKDVVVIGEIPAAAEDANFLGEICRNVYYMPLFKSMGRLNPKVQVIEGKPSEIMGDDFVEGVKTDVGEIKCQGVFLVKESIPASSLMPEIEMENGSIKVNRLMETNVAGVYACGDCTGWPYQLGNAVGDGLVAAQQADKYLSKLLNFDIPASENIF